MNNKINLEEILKKVYLHELVSEERFYIVKNAIIKEFAEQLLKLAAENAKTEVVQMNICGSIRIVNKQSILDTIKQVE